MKKAFKRFYLDINRNSAVRVYNLYFFEDGGRNPVKEYGQIWGRGLETKI